MKISPEFISGAESGFLEMHEPQARFIICLGSLDQLKVEPMNSRTGKMGVRRLPRARSGEASGKNSSLPCTR